MKKIVLSITVLVFVIQSYCQTTTSPSISKDEYLKRSKDQAKVGFILLGAGVITQAVGVLIPRGNVKPVSLVDIFSGTRSYENDDTKTGLILAGFISELCSIPFFISSGKNKHRAASVSFNNQKILFPQHNALAVKTQPAITLKIRI